MLVVWLFLQSNVATSYINLSYFLMPPKNVILSSPRSFAGTEHWIIVLHCAVYLPALVPATECWIVLHCAVSDLQQPSAGLSYIVLSMSQPWFQRQSAGLSYIVLLSLIQRRPSAGLSYIVLSLFPTSDFVSLVRTSRADITHVCLTGTLSW
jgi:hypothetical protein